MNKNELPNFIEVDSVEKANDIDLTVYRFERYSETKDAYIFVKRKVKINKRRFK